MLGLKSVCMIDPPESKFPGKNLNACVHLVGISYKLNVPEKLEVLGQTGVPVLLVVHLSTALSFYSKC